MIGDRVESNFGANRRSYFRALLNVGDASGTVAGLGGDSNLIFIW